MESRLSAISVVPPNNGCSGSQARDTITVLINNSYVFSSFHNLQTTRDMPTSSLFGLQHVFTKNITKMGSLVLREPRKIGVVRTRVNLKSVHENRPKLFLA